LWFDRQAKRFEKYKIGNPVEEPVAAD
jgi:hypothetical protein